MKNCLGCRENEAQYLYPKRLCGSCWHVYAYLDKEFISKPANLKWLRKMIASVTTKGKS